MDTIIVNKNIKLVPYFENYDTTLKWYKDRDVCKQVDNIDFVYDIDRLQKEIFEYKLKATNLSLF